MRNIEKYKHWFESYSKTFLKTLKYRIDEYNLKIKHTHEVVAAGIRIADTLELGDFQYRACLLALLFHDVGRFKQYHDFGTFKDNLSVNHGELAKDILLENGILDEETSIVKQMVLTAVHYHNIKNIPDYITGDELTILQIVRDADKIDIFRVVTEQYKMEKTSRTVMLNLTDTPGMTQSVYECVRSKIPVDYLALNTADDFKALQLGWVYDLNYKKSLELLMEKEYHTQVYDAMLKDERAELLFSEVVSYIRDRLA